MNKIFLLCLFAILQFVTTSAKADAASSRYTIRGTVTDECNSPLPGALIAVSGTTIKQGTNSKGMFEITVNENRNYDITASYVGFQPKHVIARPGQNASITLFPSRTNLNEVVVTGTRSDRPLKDMPVLTRVISRREIETINAIDLTTLLQTALPGLQFSYNDMSQATEITYQGLGGKAVLFLLDGERISGEGGANNIDYGRFNVNDIDRIEIVRGAAATLYDSRAIGGVINIITRKGFRPVTARVSTRYAGQNGEMYSVSAGVNRKNFSTLTLFGYRKRESYTIADSIGKVRETRLSNGVVKRDTLPTYQSTIHGYSILDVSQKLSYVFNDQLRADFQGSYYNNRRPSNEYKKLHQVYTDLTLSGKLSYIPSSNQNIELTVIRDDYQKTNVFDKVDLKEHVYRNINTTGRLYYSGTLGKHTISAGVDYACEDLKHYFLPDTAQMHTSQFSCCLQEDWKPWRKLNIVAGVRADKVTRYKMHFTPKLSVMYRPWAFVTARAGYSQGYRAPNLKELYQEWTMGGLIQMYGNPNLKPEVGSQLSASVEYDKNGLNLSLSSYYNNYLNKITYAYVHPEKNMDMRWENADSVRTFGVEATANYKFVWGLQLAGAYTYITDYNKKNGYNLSWLRPHSAKLSAVYSKKWGKTTETLSLYTNWVSALSTYTYKSNKDEQTGKSVESFTREDFEARTICSLNLRSQLPHGITIGVMIDNLLNYKDKAVDSGLQYPQNGRTYVATISINIADMLKL